MDFKFKKECFLYCENFLAEKIQQEKLAMDETQAMGNASAKSASGDKFDSERADSHRETEKHTIQLANWLALRDTLAQIKLDDKHKRIHLGSLVETREALYFISVGLGKISVAGKKVFALSLDSPIAKQLLGKAASESFVFREKKHEIISVI